MKDGVDFTANPRVSQPASLILARTSPVPDLISRLRFAVRHVGHGVVVPLRSGHLEFTDLQTVAINKQPLLRRRHARDRKLKHDESPSVVISGHLSG